MIVNHFIYLVLLNIYVSNAAVFLWSNKKLEISPLQPFTMEQFSNLIKELGDPEVYIFKSPSTVFPYIKGITKGYHSAYIPNGDIYAENATDLVGDEVIDILNIKEVQKETNRSANTLSVIIVTKKQYKRELDDNTNFGTQGVKATNSPIASKGGPVMYKSKNNNDNLFALLYSSKPLLLKMNDSDQPERHLGSTYHDMIIYDTRLNVNVIPLEGGAKISLRFSFSWLNGYWSMPSVKVTDTGSSRDYNLTTDENIMAPAHFSYHCNGYTVFSDTNGVELYIYDLQVQIDSKNEKFGDANDCVSFTTAPIWSGLFVTTLLGIGLIVALTAIMDIKTMDKFDNCKTKNLPVTISE